MKLTFLGGAKEVGKSCVLVQDKNQGGKDGTAIFLDAGMKMANKDQPEEKLVFPALEENSKFLIVSHAHMDHSGRIAPWSKKYPKSKIIATPSTFETAKILIESGMKIKRQDFTSSDLRQAERQFWEMKTGHTFRAGNFEGKLFNAGHLLGAVQTLLETAGQKLWYTGDVRISETTALNGAEIPGKKDQPNVLIIESTYATTNQANRRLEEERFLTDIQKTLKNGGTTLVPAFAAGRTIEILAIIKRGNFKVPIYLDGLGIAATKNAQKYADEFKNPNMIKNILRNVLTKPANPEDLEENSIIVTTAGMLAGGPVIRYMQELSNAGRNSVHLTGYQAEGTIGWNLLNLKEFDGNPVNMQVFQYQFSGHADSGELMQLVLQINPDQVFCMHGDENNCETFAQNIRDELGIPAVAPGLGQSFEF